MVRIEDGGEKLDWDNLQSMCHKCHNRKSAKERHYKKQGNDKR
ncbi:HNH endonuclease [Marinifilum flexuosum]